MDTARRIAAVDRQPTLIEARRLGTPAVPDRKPLLGAAGRMVELHAHFKPGVVLHVGILVGDPLVQLLKGYIHVAVHLALWGSLVNQRPPGGLERGGNRWQPRPVAQQWLPEFPFVPLPVRVQARRQGVVNRSALARRAAQLQAASFGF